MNLQGETSQGQSLPCHVFWQLVKYKWRCITCHMTSQNHVSEGSSNFMSGSFSWYATTLPSLVAIGIVLVGI